MFNEKCTKKNRTQIKRRNQYKQQGIIVEQKIS